MAKPILDDELWVLIAPLFPPDPPRPKGGRPRVPPRVALTGILFVLRTGIPWEDLPQELGCGSGMTCWRRLRDWQAAGIWERIHQTLLGRLSERGAIDWSRAALDSASVPAKKGSTQPARIRRIEVNRAQNTILWSKLKAFPWRSRSREQMYMTAGSLKRCSMPYRRSKGLKDSSAKVRTSCMRTKRMTLPTVGGHCGSVASKVASPGAASSLARG
jgi:transposase